MNDGDDDDEDESDFGNGKAAFDSDDEDDLLDNTGIADSKKREGSVDMFDTLKSEDDPTPQKTAPTKRKLGSKPEVVKPPTKRAKKAIVSDSDGNSPVKVNIL